MSAAWPIPKKLLFRTKEVAALLGCSEKTVYRHMKEGEFDPLFKRKNQSKITYQGLRNYLEAHLEPLEQE